MNINRDYSYIKEFETKLINAGYGEITVHSLHFDRYISEEQKIINRKLFSDMTDNQRTAYFDSKEFKTVQMDFAKSLEEVILLFDKKFDIHQTTQENSTMKHYKSDWDLYFCSDRGWNNKDYMQHFSLTFNRNRTPERNMKLLEDIITILKSIENEKVYCRIQYDAYIDTKKVAEEARKIFDGIARNFVEMFGYVGKIKIVSDDSESVEYGFFQKGAKKKYYPVSDMELVSMNL